MSSANNDGFKVVEKSEPWVPNEVNDYLLGVITEVGAKDNKPSSKFLVVRTKERILDGDGEPVIGPLLKGDGTQATDPETGKPLEGPQYKDKLFRVSDAETVREFEKRVGKVYDQSKSAYYISLKVLGFVGEKRWPNHEISFAEGIHGPRAMRSAANDRGGVYFVHHVRPLQSSSGGSSGGSAAGGSQQRTAMDDIPF